MSDSYRHRCGECGHRTAWGTESRGEQAIETHYAHRHPHIAPRTPHDDAHHTRHGGPCERGRRQGS